MVVAEEVALGFVVPSFHLARGRGFDHWPVGQGLMRGLSIDSEVRRMWRRRGKRV